MGWHQHHAIIVTSWSDKGIEQAHQQAIDTFAVYVIDGVERGWLCAVSPISPPAMNGYRSFAVFPDGSKEGWQMSDDADAARAEYTAWLDANYGRPNWWSWVEVMFANEDDQAAAVIREGTTTEPTD